MALTREDSWKICKTKSIKCFFADYSQAWWNVRIVLSAFRFLKQWNNFGGSSPWRKSAEKMNFLLKSEPQRFRTSTGSFIFARFYAAILTALMEFLFGHKNQNRIKTKSKNVKWMNPNPCLSGFYSAFSACLLKYSASFRDGVLYLFFEWGRSSL